jgi:hypothetical protein
VSVRRSKVTDFLGDVTGGNRNRAYAEPGWIRFQDSVAAIQRFLTGLQNRTPNLGRTANLLILLRN